MPATLQDIRIKIRRLTRSPSATQITDGTIDEYINNFLLYDFSERNRLFAYRTTLKFYTYPYVDVYDTNTIRATDPLYNFKNAYITVHDPVYINGYRAYFSQSRSEFYNIYPALNSSVQIGTGDAATVLFAGTLSSVPLLQEHLLFTSIDANNEAVFLKDVPIVDGVTGIRIVLGDLIWPTDATSRGTINYVTGDYTLTFPAAPNTGEPIYAQAVSYQAAKPQSILYFDNKFMVRPVPDKTYEISIETYIRPTALVNAADKPLLEQTWEYIAYGAARKILQDRLDTETLAIIEPEFKNQELLVNRRTIVQQSNERTGTIYTQQIGGWNGNNFS